MPPVHFFGVTIPDWVACLFPYGNDEDGEDADEYLEEYLEDMGISPNPVPQQTSENVIPHTEMMKIQAYIHLQELEDLTTDSRLEEVRRRWEEDIKRRRKYKCGSEKRPHRLDPSHTGWTNCIDCFASVHAGGKNDDDPSNRDVERIVERLPPT